ncbi:MAG: MBL fold metallo-hydrolase [Dialister invisus]
MKRFIKYFLCLLISLCAFAGTGCGFDVFGSGSGTAADAPLIIRMLDIGQGDAILIERNGKLALIDTGDVEHRPRMAEYLRKYGVKKVDTVIITHPHGDHIGGMFSVFANAEIRQVYDNGVPTSLSTYKTYRKIPIKSTAGHRGQ